MSEKRVVITGSASVTCCRSCRWDLILRLHFRCAEEEQRRSGDNYAMETATGQDVQRPRDMLLLLLLLLLLLYLKAHQSPSYHIAVVVVIAVVLFCISRVVEFVDELRRFAHLCVI